MSEVLILGNGISRLLHEEFIAAWKGELWGCNRIYLHYGPRLTRLTGHIEVLREAREYRKATGCTFEIWGGHLGGVDDDTKRFTCPAHFCKDSGTTLVAQALEEGFERIVCCGFDLGGVDVYSPEVATANKKNWVLRWRLLAQHYGLDRIEFLGHDHKPYILSDASEAAYMKRYRRGRPHIPDAEYRELFEKVTGWTPGKVEDEVVDVEYLKGPRVGWRTQYNTDVAQILADRGEVRILSKEKAAEEPESAAEPVDEPDLTTEPPKKKAGRPPKKKVETEE